MRNSRETAGRRKPDAIGTASRRRVFEWRAALPWFALVALLAVPPSVSQQSWLLAYLAQTATMIVFALSYNLLLGETGLLSFGHAAYAGLGALVAAHAFNRHGIALPWLPLVGGVGGALGGAIGGAIATRRAGTAFAMITLGIGELVSAAAWTLPDWFGGEAGVPIDRASGPAWGPWTFGPTREAYALIAIWCVAACLAMWAVSRTPLVRMANAVRDNPVRAAALGCDPRRVRYLMFVLSSFFAGVAGTLGLVNVELVSTESVSMLRSGAVLIATVTGGTTAFFGPVAGAVVLVLLSVPLAGVTRAWPFYLGLFFVVVVAGSPDGLAGFVARARARLSAYGTRTCLHPSLLNLCAASTWTLAVVLVVQWAYAMQSSDGTAGNGVWLGGATPGSPASIAGLLAATGALAGIGWLASHRARRLWTQLERSTPRGAAPDEAGGAR